MDHLSIGIVGSSFWAEFAYLQRLTDHPRAKFVALCARDQQRAQSIAGKYGISRIEADWRRLLDKHDLDALIVVAPDDLHKEIVLSACERKLAVLCEKPLANSATDAWTMQRAAAQAGITNMVMFTWRWQPHFVFLNDLLKRGELGRPLRAQLGFLAGYMRTPEYSWRMDPRRSNGNFADLGSHMIDLARFFFGDPSSVTAQLGTAIDRSRVSGLEGVPVNDNARALLGYEDGPQVFIETSCVTPMGDRFMTQIFRLETTTTSLTLDYHFAGNEQGLHLRIADGDAPWRTLEVPRGYYGRSDAHDFMDIYGNESVGARHFVDCALEGRLASPDFGDAARVQEVVDAALRSSVEQVTVDLI